MGIILQSDEVFGSKLHVVVDRLSKAGVRWVVFAGAAVYCYGSDREVTDIDVLVEDEHLEKVKAVLADVEDVDVVADLKIQVAGETCLFFMDEEMVENIKRRKLFDVEIPVVPVEDNVIFKAILQRGENEGKHDVEDIEHMASHERMDLEYLEKRIQKYHAGKRVKPLLRSLGILSEL
jgi:predicted nucleotidyltransferase